MKCCQSNLNEATSISLHKLSNSLFTNQPIIRPTGNAHYVISRWQHWEWSVKDKKGKAIPVRGLGGPQGCEMSRLPHFLGNRLTNVCEVVSLTRRSPFTPQEDSWHSFLLKAESNPGPLCG
jgi:hypothetical protein